MENKNHCTIHGVLKSLDTKSGEGQKGAWNISTLLVEFEHQKDSKTFKETIQLQYWGTQSQLGIMEGEEADFTFIPKFREYNGKWYSNLEIVSVSVDRKGGFVAAPPISSKDDKEDFLPF